jgi:hypothetical protein
MVPPGYTPKDPHLAVEPGDSLVPLPSGASSYIPQNHPGNHSQYISVPDRGFEDLAGNMNIVRRKSP